MSEQVSKKKAWKGGIPGPCCVWLQLLKRPNHAGPIFWQLPRKGCVPTRLPPALAPRHCQGLPATPARSSPGRGGGRGRRWRTLTWPSAPQPLGATLSGVGLLPAPLGPLLSPAGTQAAEGPCPL